MLEQAVDAICKQDTATDLLEQGSQPAGGVLKEQVLIDVKAVVLSSAKGSVKSLLKEGLKASLEGSTDLGGRMEAVCEQAADAMLGRVVERVLAQGVDTFLRGSTSEQMRQGVKAALRAGASKVVSQGFAAVVQEGAYAVEGLLDKGSAAVTAVLKGDAGAMINEAFGLADKLWRRLTQLDSSDKLRNRATEVLSMNIEDLEMKPPAVMEMTLLQYSPLLKLGVNAVTTGLRSLPFCEVAAGVLTAFYTHAEQAALLSRNADMLLRRAKLCHRRLASLQRKLASGGQSSGDQDQHAMRVHMKELLAVIQEAGRFLKDYSKGGFFKRMITSSSDKEKLDSLDTRLGNAMQELALTTSIANLGSMRDESAQLRTALCSASQMEDTPENAQQALDELAQKAPKKLQALLYAHLQERGDMALQLINSELQALGVRVEQLEADVAGVKVQLAELKAEWAEMKDWRVAAEARLTKVEVLLAEREAKATTAPLSMPPYLLELWEKRWRWALKTNVPGMALIGKLVAWFKEEGQDGMLKEYDAELAGEGLLELLRQAATSERADSKPSQQPATRQAERRLSAEEVVCVFVEVVVLRLLDSDSDGSVTRSELYSLHFMAVEYATRKKCSMPEDLATLINALYLGFNRQQLRAQLELKKAAGRDLQAVEAALNVDDILCSYNIARLLDEYHPGSRQWMYDKVNEWLDGCINARMQVPARVDGAEAERSQPSRAFLLLADAGMGKSVFSGVIERKLTVRANKEQRLILVRHFFKVGQARARARAMLCAMAVQLAQQLPGYAAMLAPAARDYANPGGGSRPNIKEMFDKFLLGPLTALDGNMGSGARPCVLLLLDALDEADDDGRGWEPVASLIASEFQRLPPWVYVLLTGRPQVAEGFSRWSPVWIRPSDHQNKDDLRALLSWRLGNGGYVAEENVKAAVDIMLAKSEGQFIYSKYAFEELPSPQQLASGTARQMSLEELTARLPAGLAGMYRHIMDTLVGALHADEQHELLALLRERLLPVLAVCPEALSVEELAWATGASPPQVCLLVRLLANLFPLRTAASPSSGLAAEAAVGSGPAASSTGDATAAGGTSTALLPYGDLAGMCVQPYHKSVLDWLLGESGMDAGEHAVNLCAAASFLTLFYCTRTEAVEDNMVAALRQRLELCRKQLAALASLQLKLAPGGQGGADVSVMRVHMKQLLAVIQEAGQFVMGYSKRGFLLRMIRSANDKQQFEELDMRLICIMQELSMETGLLASMPNT